jgi:hypothetical protein
MRLSQAELATCFAPVSCLTYSSTLKVRRHDLPKRPLIFNGLHRIISQKTELFITTAVRTTNRKKDDLGCICSMQGGKKYGIVKEMAYLGDLRL